MPHTHMVLACRDEDKDEVMNHDRLIETLLVNLFNSTTELCHGVSLFQVQAL